MSITLIASTNMRYQFFSLAERLGFSVDWGLDGEQLSEFAGRACYQSWDKPNPSTAKTPDYLAHILDVGHFSVLEHASATFYLEDVSRSFTHELVRHRHLSYSQLSQRYVNMDETKPVIPPALADFSGPVKDAYTEALYAYNLLVETLSESEGVTRKQAREAARCVLPNATPTSIVVTGNYRAWLEFLGKRDNPAADAEMQEIAAEIRRQLVGIAPSIFGVTA